MSARSLKIYFDGGCRPNPGPIETAVVARGEVWIERDLGAGDNSEAEWLAALHALRIGAVLGETDVILVGDSALVVGRASGRLPCRGAMIPHLATFREAAAGFARVRIRHVKRAQNLAGIALERLHGRL